ncbi:response regulator transcription factor [Psychrosphaera algicola]
MVSSDDAPEIMQKAIDFGAAAFIPKSADLTVISDAITAVLEGDTWLPKDANLPSQTNHNDKKLAKQLALLTPQQYVVLSQIADGQLNKQIAYDLNIKETTVKKHVSAILLKLEVTNRTMAGMAFQQLTLN